MQRLVRQAPHIISIINSHHNSKLKFSTMHSSARYVPTATIRWSSNCLTTQSWLWECVVAAAGEASPSQTSSLASISTHNSKLRFSTMQSSALNAPTATFRSSSNCWTTKSWPWECVVAAAGEASPSQTSSLASISTQNSKLRFSTLQSSALSARTATT